jgi:hypothetical protein
MPATPGLVLTIQTPTNNSIVKLNQPVAVTGTVVVQVTSEPIGLDSVTLQLDSGPPVHATVSRSTTNKNKNLIVFNYSGAIAITGGNDPHTLAVSAIGDRGAPVHQSRQLFTGVLFAVDAPAILVEVLGFLAADGSNPLDPKLPTTIGLAQSMQAQLKPLSDALATYNQILAGPNMYSAPAPPGFCTLRLGFWIEDRNFPVLPADPKHGFPLPLLPDAGAIAGLALLPRLSPPAPRQITPTFAVQVPLAALQRLALAVFPTIQAQVAGSAALDSITVRSDDNAFIADIKGSYLHLGFTLSIHESFGITHVGSSTSAADPDRTAPTVTRSSIELDSSLIVKLLALLLPPLNLFLQLARLIVLNPKIADENKSLSGTLADTLNACAARIPFSNTELPFPNPPDFPRIILNWDTFSSTSDGILGTGFTALDARDESMASIPLSGPGEVTGTAADVGGGVIPPEYAYGFVNMAPDAASVQWRVSGTGAAGGNVNLANATFPILLPMPKRPQPGTAYPFTLTVTAAETCGTDKTKVIHASVTQPVRVVVKKSGKNPQLSTKKA